MGSLARLFPIILAILVALPALGDDQQKAKKELNKVTAMATDGTGRRIVNLTMAEALKEKRVDLLLQRRETGLNYGCLFLARQLVAAGGKIEDISAELKTGKSIYQIAEGQHVDWKEMAAKAKDLNKRIDDYLYKHFSGDAGEQEQDKADNYNLAYDGVPADSDVSQSEISQAQDRYLMWRNRAEETSRRANRLNTTQQNAAYRDNVRSGGPQGAGAASGGAPPAAGGPR